MVSLRHIAEFLFYQKIKILVYLLPRTVCLYSGRIIGWLVYLLDKKHRAIAFDNLKTAFGSEFSSRLLKRISRQCFMHFGQVFLDIIKFPSLREEKKKEVFVVEGKENLEKALQCGRGVLLFTAHYGNWEIGSSFLSWRGKLSVIARRLDNRILEKELLKLRTKLGARVIYKHQASKKILHSLRNKEMVAFLIDQNVLRSQAVFVDFFGKKAATTPSLAAFYLRTKSPLLPAFCYPLSLGRYQIEIHAPLEMLLVGDYDQDVLKITQRCTKIIENQIRKNPACWFWFHRRWKTRPKEKA